MKVIIIGAGVIGSLTAYYLAKKGVNVTIFERNENCGDETSDANASQLSFSYLYPLASKVNLTRFVKNFLKDNKNNPISFNFKDPDFIKFALGYLNDMRFKNYSASQKRLLTLSLLSYKKLNEFLEEEPISFKYNQTGKIQLFYDKENFLSAKFFAKKLITEHNVKMQGFPRSKTIETEPALNSYKGGFNSSIFSPIDGVGDCKEFTQNLIQILKDKFDNVRVINEDVINIIRDGNNVKSVQTRNNEYSADKFIVASGSYSKDVMKFLSFKIPVFPAKGYTLITDNNIGLKVSVTDTQKRIVFSPIGDRLKIAGITDFKGLNKDIEPDRVALLKKLANSGFPDLRLEDAEVKLGLRPMTTNSMPMIGRHELDNLYLNTGHGMLGWTLSFGSASRLADMVSESN